MISVITNVDSAPKFFIDVDCPWFTGSICIIDLSWYSRFKDLGDSVICCFAYLSFLWHVFIRLPDIISGSSAVTYSDNMSGDIDTFRRTGFGRGFSFKNRGF